jgi:ketol-acid reductoisomerase
MTGIFYEADADLAHLAGQQVAVVGYGNQGRPWALNLRDSGLDVRVHLRDDDTARRAEADGFAVADIAEAGDADVICLLVPDDVIPELDITPGEASLVVVASGYSLAFDRLHPPGDAAMVAPRMLGPEVRACYQEGSGFITAVGVEHDRTGTARARTLALALALGGLREGAIEMTARQEAILDLAVEQVLSPALTAVSTAFLSVMTEEDIPLEAIVTELVLSGEVERTYRLLRRHGFAVQNDFHSPTSQYGQLSRRGRYDHLDIAAAMRPSVDEIANGRFAEEWDAERSAGYPHLQALREEHAGPVVREFEAELRSRLGPGVSVR